MRRRRLARAKRTRRTGILALGVFAFAAAMAAAMIASSSTPRSGEPLELGFPPYWAEIERGMSPERVAEIVGEQPKRRESRGEIACDYYALLGVSEAPNYRFCFKGGRLVLKARY